MKTYRAYGQLGALLDEYERVIDEMLVVIDRIPHDRFSEAIDSLTPDPDCRSFQSIMNHVCGAGLRYIAYIATIFSQEYKVNAVMPQSPAESASQLRDIFVQTELYLNSKKDIPADDPVWAKTIVTRWDAIYNFEQMMEHAIVHVMRHRRQIERFLLQLETNR